MADVPHHPLPKKKSPWDVSIGFKATKGIPQPTSTPGHPNGLIGPPLHRGGFDPNPIHVPKPGSKPKVPTYKSGERAAKLRQLRHKAGITRAELRKNKKLNQSASLLGTGVQGRGKLLQAYDKQALRDLISKLRKVQGNPKGLNYDAKPRKVNTQGSPTYPKFKGKAPSYELPKRYGRKHRKPEPPQPFPHGRRY